MGHKKDGITIGEIKDAKEEFEAELLKFVSTTLNRFMEQTKGTINVASVDIDVNTIGAYGTNLPILCEVSNVKLRLELNDLFEE